AGVRALGAMDGEERLALAQDALEGPRLVAARGGDGVAVHGIARPHDHLSLALDGTDERRQVLADLVGAVAADQRQPAWLVVGAEDVHEFEEAIGGERRPALDAE